MSHKVKSLITFFVFLIAAYVLLIKGITPFVTEVATSDLFLIQSDDPAEKFTSVKNEKTQAAVAHCSQHLQENFDLAPSARLDTNEYTAWALGNYTYIIKSYVISSGTTQDPANKLFACRIQYEGGDEYSAENWSISQFSYNDS